MYANGGYGIVPVNTVLYGAGGVVIVDTGLFLLHDLQSICLVTFSLHFFISGLWTCIVSEFMSFTSVVQCAAPNCYLVLLNRLLQ